MVSHHRERHGVRGVQNDGKNIVTVQTLFSGLGLKYFIVSPHLRYHSQESPFSALISKVLPKMPQLQLQVPVKSRDILPLHRVTRWWDILGPHALNKQSRKTIISLVGPVHKEEVALSTLPALCEEYLVEAQMASKTAGYTIRKQLVPEE